MTSYIGILEKEPTSLWGIWFPDLKGCIAAARTSEEVLSQVGPVLAQWIELALEDGGRLPPPRSIEELRHDAEVEEALAKGDVAIAVPLPGDMLGFDGPSLSAIDAAAAKRGVTRLDFVREAVLDKIAS